MEDVKHRVGLVNLRWYWEWRPMWKAVMQRRKRGILTKNRLSEDVPVLIYTSTWRFVGGEMSRRQEYSCKQLFIHWCRYRSSFKTTRGRRWCGRRIFSSKTFTWKIFPNWSDRYMYYAAKDPIPLASEKRELPKVNSSKLNEETTLCFSKTFTSAMCTAMAQKILMRSSKCKKILYWRIWF